ncbi:MAG TPA: universal stress protein UspA [Gallionella sp.]|jgi:nucleotide-binding universal stress UspA family protein|nr:universal stress protein [Gallionella sp.]OGS66872.1 MAG: universal stress protein UspA [Gallionellales bacterium GWA2_54_124]OGT19662.1 MAG: universal stress protein UspA [Gallionellales bacterium RIFOXYD12_FULL_53_10]OGT29375.1 MAG: universal stress protein UspA [Gallionellales bacterium RIFOXYD2_FULL_52_7]HCI53758.1 universal stress protein UspA [Gallionella sp.]
MKILIPLDGSADSLHAITYVVSHRQLFGESPVILLLNVQWKVATGNVKLFINQDTINDYYREQGMLALQPARDALDAAALPYQYHVSVGTPSDAIAQYACEQGVDQIVMCRQGQGGLQTFLLGSVVTKVLHLAECPVLLVK